MTVRNWKMALTISNSSMDLETTEATTSQTFLLTFAKVLKGDKGDKGDGGIVKGYLYNGVFYEDASHTVPLTGGTENLYVNLGVDGRDLYMFNGSAYLRVSNSALTKEEADTLYADKTHTHAHTDITDMSWMMKTEIENILNN